MGMRQWQTCINILDNGIILGGFESPFIYVLGSLNVKVIRLLLCAKDCL